MFSLTCYILSIIGILKSNYFYEILHIAKLHLNGYE